MEFANFVEKFKPKLVLLENVTGILRAFQDGGKKYHAWVEVAKAFVQKGYLPLCLHVNARYAGVPQNRPRFIMIGVREDVFKKIKPKTKPARDSTFFICREFLPLSRERFR